jgi:hypothetical protein
MSNHKRSTKERNALASKILLTVLVAAPMAFGIGFFALGYPLYGALLTLGGLAILLWVWGPWRSRKESD